MFAVIGTWPVDGALEVDQLTHIADSVRQQPGFRHGYWGQDPTDTTRAHAFVVLDDEAAAKSMAEGVRQAIRSATVAVLEVLASA